MVGAEAALEVRVLHRHGKSIREIARETGISRNTVRRYLRDEEAARYKPRPPRPTKLDPFKRYVIERVGAAAPEWIPASVLLMELRERGYSGGYTMLKLFVASLRPKQAVPPVIRFTILSGSGLSRRSLSGEAFRRRIARPALFPRATARAKRLENLMRTNLGTGVRASLRC